LYLAGRKTSSGPHLFQLALLSLAPMRTIPTIDYAEAKRAVDLIVEKALEMQKAVVVLWVDDRAPNL
jgi:hypothetical protein